MKPAVAFLVFAPALGFAQVTAKGGAYLLRVHYKKGAKIEFTVKNVSSVIKKPIVVTAELTTLSVAATGATLRATISSVAGRPPQSVTYAVDDRNRASGGASFGASLPEKPVKVGETWSASIPIPSPSGGSGGMNATYTFRGLKTVNGLSVAILDLAMSGEVKGKGQMAILTSDGTLYSSDVSVTVGAQGQSVTVRSITTRK